MKKIKIDSKDIFIYNSYPNDGLYLVEDTNNNFYIMLVFHGIVIQIEYIPSNMDKEKMYEEIKNKFMNAFNDIFNDEYKKIKYINEKLKKEIKELKQEINIKNNTIKELKNALGQQNALQIKHIQKLIATVLKPDLVLKSNKEEDDED